MAEISEPQKEDTPQSPVEENKAKEEDEAPENPKIAGNEVIEK